ncbi:MAG: glycogen/starch/alpha-glucan phosphorylase [Anaerolineae bacterium]|nr:MAG: glycogen/starch/alpha-glucan phosphorylase [Anaerolineae bacterium]
MEANNINKYPRVELNRNGRTGRSVQSFKRALADNLYYVRGQDIYTATDIDIYTALSYTVRDHLIDRWRKTVDVRYEEDPRFVVYLSAEYLLGQQLSKNLLYTDLTDVARQALAEYGHNLDYYLSLDPEPGLGNGGLGRLAACFLDSLATMNMPCIGYGIRYEFGIFKQLFVDGWQVESPDKWLHFGYPWEFAHPDDMVEVHFGGHTEGHYDKDGRYRVRWIPGEKVLGEPYRLMLPGYNVKTVNMLRLWRARASKEFDFQLFDVGDYAQAVEQKTNSENISKVLYPNDNSPQGKELRLKQQYFFVACSLRDIIKIFQIKTRDWSDLAQKIVIQLNDTHPVIAIPELMRILVDENDLEWQDAWSICRRIFASTQHTLMPEALEVWPVDLIGRLLPRHLEIIFEINERFLAEVREKYPDDPGRVSRMSIIEEGSERQVRMAFLACVGSFSINGVADLQSTLLKERIFSDFYEMWPEKFNNKTNGVTPRRFIRLANPRLAALISRTIGDDWISDLTQINQLEAHIDDEGFRREWRQVKQANKEDLARIIRETLAIEVNAASIYDVMVKRLHEYKRQLLKVLHIIALYNRAKVDPTSLGPPRTFVFGAKAAPGYHMAKLIIKLINSVAETVNSDPDLEGMMKVAFLPNFNVSIAEKIYAAADISEQISLAGKEASGTGNMKLALNGALTVGTMDGANIEIRQLIGKENFFAFGLTVEEVFALRESGYNPQEYYNDNLELKSVIDMIASGFFSKNDSTLYKPITDSLIYHDEYMLLADFQSYIDAQEVASAAFLNADGWTRKSILNVTRAGYFSSDRSIKEYCQEIWKIKPVQVE